MADACESGSLDEANEILGLMMRHWNNVASTLDKGEVYVPLLLEKADGMAHGNDWARGFMRGMGMRHDGWTGLVNGSEPTPSTRTAQFILKVRDSLPG